MTFEDVDKHVDAHAHLTAPKDHAEATANLCTYWKAVAPILSLVMSFPFFPAKWKTTLQNFIAALSLICP